MSGLEVTTRQTPEGQVLTFKGVIDEHSNFDSISIANQKVLVLDLAGVELLNSTGIREWVIWMKQKVPSSTHFIFSGCSRPVVDQINIMRGLLPAGAQVESFYVPFYCEKCDEEYRFLYRRGQEFEPGTADMAPKIKSVADYRCPNCQGDLELDVMPKYFKFLNYR